MNKLKKILAAASVGMMLLVSVVVPVKAVAPWNVTGDYQITFMLDGDPTPYVHHAELVQNGTSVTGDGGYPATGSDTFHWNVVTGLQTGDSLNLTVEYDLGAAGTDMTMTGTIASDGTVSGTWTDNLNGDTRNGTWSITSGVSTPVIHTPANNASVTSSALTEVDWTDAIGSNPPFQYQYEAYSDANYTNLVYSSTWLTDSEIATLGTPPGEYYLRVRARDEAMTAGAWSNGASNPYHITVTADVPTTTPTVTPTPNPFAVPAECSANGVTYGAPIIGTEGSDYLNGTNGNDLIFALGGSDLVDGNGGHDCIVAGAGSDYVKGGNGDDIVLGGGESDSLIGENGNDTLHGQAGSDSLNGANGNDNLYGGEGSDALSGGAGNDNLMGDAGSDAAQGSTGTDTCVAEAESSCELNP